MKSATDIANGGVDDLELVGATEPRSERVGDVSGTFQLHRARGKRARKRIVDPNVVAICSKSRVASASRKLPPTDHRAGTGALCAAVSVMVSSGFGSCP